MGAHRPRFGENMPEKKKHLNLSKLGFVSEKQQLYFIYTCITLNFD